MNAAEPNRESSESAATEASVHAASPVRVRYRIRFGKTDLLRWISHRDLARLWERLLRRARLQLSMTEGFHPKPRVGFPSALALGWEGLDEVVEIDLAEPLEPAALLERLRADRQPGLTIHSVAQVPAGTSKARLRKSHYLIRIAADALPPAIDAAAIDSAIMRLRETETVTVVRKEKQKTIQLSEQLRDIAWTDEGLRLVLAASEAVDLKPTDVLSAMGLDSLMDAGATVVRTRVELEQPLGPEVRVHTGTNHEERDVDQCGTT